MKSKMYMIFYFFRIGENVSVELKLIFYVILCLMIIVLVVNCFKN